MAPDASEAARVLARTAPRGDAPPRYHPTPPRRHHRAPPTPHRRTPPQHHHAHPRPDTRTRHPSPAPTTHPTLRQLTLFPLPSPRRPPHAHPPGTDRSRSSPPASSTPPPIPATTVYTAGRSPPLANSPHLCHSRVVPPTTNHRNLVDALLDRELDSFVTNRRDQGQSWEQIAASVNQAIGEVAVSGETLRRWYS